MHLQCTSGTWASGFVTGDYTPATQYKLNMPWFVSTCTATPSGPVVRSSDALERYTHIRP